MWPVPPARAEPASAASSFRWLTIMGAPVRWQGAATTGRLLRYSFVKSPTRRADAVNCGGLGPPRTIDANPLIGRERLAAAARRAFDRWEAVTPIRFVESEDDRSAHIVIGEQARPFGHAFADVSVGAMQADGTRPIEHAAICLNPERSWKVGFDGNLTSYDLVHTLTHEIGHAIGLDHPGARGHVMSFKYDEARHELTDGDRLGARTIYGFIGHAARPSAAAAKPDHGTPDHGASAAALERDPGTLGIGPGSASIYAR